MDASEFQGGRSSAGALAHCAGVWGVSCSRTASRVAIISLAGWNVPLWWQCAAKAAAKRTLSLRVWVVLAVVTRNCSLKCCKQRDQTWRQLNMVGDGPDIRCGHAVVLHSNEMYLFGGSEDRKARGELWKLPLQADPDGALPA